MGSLIRKNFFEIITESQYFEEKSDEVRQLQLKYKNLIQDIDEQKSIKKVLDYGCGDGRFLQSLIINKSFSQLKAIELTLVEPNLNFKTMASDRLSPYFEKKILWIDSNLKEINSGYNVIFANHLLQHVDQLKMKMAKLMQSLDYGGRLILTLSRFDHPLSNLVEVLAQHKGVALPSNSAMKLFHVLYEYGFYYDTIDVHSVLRLPNSEESKNKILAIALSGNKNLYSEGIVSNFFDIHTYNKDLVIPLVDQIVVVHA